MPRGIPRLRRAWGAVLCAFLFFLLGCSFLGYAGPEVDEAMFATPFYREWCFYAIRFGRQRLPIMHMSYLGALKTWLYAPVLSLLKPSPESLRVPAVLFGCATIILVWHLLDRIHGRRAAWVGAIILTTDTSFLLTTTFDWGPVALQHLLLTAVMFLAVRWYRSGRDLALAGAAFCCGLGLWDKAEFIWVLSGLCVGALLFTGAIVRRLRLRTILMAGAAFVLGVLPLLIYNLSAGQKFVTFRSNGHLTTNTFLPAVGVLRATWNGSALSDYIPNIDAVPGHPRSPNSLLEKSSFGLHALIGDRARNLFEPFLFLALLMIPFLWRTAARDALIFCLIAMFVGWAAMVASGGGLSAHHSVLVWPLPQMLVAIAFAEASLHLGRFGKPALVGAALIVALSNIEITNQYLYWLIRNGARGRWTDAIYSLASDLRVSGASRIAEPDWGMLDSLEVLQQGIPPQQVVADTFELLSDPRAIWVLHTTGNEITPGVNARVFDAARRARLEPQLLHVYEDGNGRPMFQTFRFRLR